MMNEQAGRVMKLIVKIVSIVTIICLITLGMVFFLSKNTNNLDLIRKRHFPIQTLYSHRGLNSINDKIGTLEGENSIPAFELAGKNGYKYLETDIYETKDGKFFCIHDNTTKSYSTTDILITQSLAKDVEGVKLNKIIKNANVSQEFRQKAYNIPTLEDYLQICNKYNMIPLIEIKQLQNNTSSVDNLLKIVEKYTTNFIVFSFNLPYVLRIKQYSNDILVLYLTPEDNEVTKEVVDLYASKGIGIAPPLNQVNENVCEYAFNKGYPMIIWSIDNKDQYLKRYKNWKVWMFGTNSVVL